MIEKKWSIVREADSAGWMSDGLQGDFLDVGGSRHPHRNQHLVDQVTAANDEESRVFRKKAAG